MRTSRRYFLKRLTALVSVLLSGCLGEDSQQSTTAEAKTPSSSAMPTAPATQPTPTAPPPAALNRGPVWQPSPMVEFVEGVPATISVRQFVEDPDKDPLVIALKSGALLPGITFNPSNSMIAYDGRPLGAKPETPVVVSGITFSADDGKR